jgi:hypothetical protein
MMQRGSAHALGRPHENPDGFSINSRYLLIFLAIFDCFSKMLF